jgi:hypothetical protein
MQEMDLPVAYPPKLTYQGLTYPSIEERPLRGE